MELPRPDSREPFTFAVFGDNQIYEFDPGPRFREVLAAVETAHPRFAVHVGDAIYSETNDRQVLMRKWNAYREALQALTVPVVQTLGNHDGFDRASLALWRELWGETFFYRDIGCARLVALDCETDEARVAGKQLEWLEKTLESAEGRQAFVFVHRPLFPVVGHIGRSLDRYPEDRDLLHGLFTRFRGRVRGVFHGHEHLFCHQDIDGIDYYHAAGSGSNLYTMPQQGGFYHFLLVHVSPDDVRVEIRRVGTPPEPAPSEDFVRPGETIEQWKSVLTWVTWDSSVSICPRRTPLDADGRGLDLFFDLSRNAGPWLGAQAAPSLDLRGAAAVALDIFNPGGGGLRVVPAVHSGKKKSHEGEQVTLGESMTTVRLPLAGAPKKILSSVDSLSWSFSGSGEKGPGQLALKSLRLEDGAGKLLPGRCHENWASGLLWYAWNDEVKARAAGGPDGGAELEFSLATCRQPHYFALVFPYLDFTALSGLEVDVEAPQDARKALRISLALESDRRHRSPWFPLSPGLNVVQVPFAESWLPRTARSGVRRIEWALSGTNNRFAGRVTLRRLRAGR